MARSKNEKFSSIAGVVEMDEIHENSVMPEAERTKNPNKGFDIKQYGNKLTTSKLMTKWLKQSNTLEWAKDDIIKEFDKMIDVSLGMKPLWENALGKDWEKQMNREKLRALYERL